MKNRTIITLLSVVSICLIVQRPISYAAGKTAGEFLLIGVGARAQGLSSAYTALTDDVNSIYWNPAGLDGVRQSQISFMYNKWIADTGYQYLAVAVPSKMANIGISVHSLDYGDIVGRESQVAVPYTFTAKDTAITCAFGRNISGNHSIGLNIKYIEQQIETVKSQGYAVDLGWKYGLDKVTLGLTVQNIGPKMKFVHKESDLPLTVSAGVGYKLAGVLNIALDVKNQVYDNSTVIAVGSEFVSFNAISIRGGYMLVSKSTQNSPLAGLAGGVGLKLGNNSTVDYAFTPFGELGDTQRVSFTMKFAARPKTDKYVIRLYKENELLKEIPAE